MPRFLSESRNWPRSVTGTATATVGGAPPGKSFGRVTARPEPRSGSRPLTISPDSTFLTRSVICWTSMPAGAAALIRYSASRARSLSDRAVTTIVWAPVVGVHAAAGPSRPSTPIHRTPRVRLLRVILKLPSALRSRRVGAAHRERPATAGLDIGAEPGPRVQPSPRSRPPINEPHGRRSGPIEAAPVPIAIPQDGPDCAEIVPEPDDHRLAEHPVRLASSRFAILQRSG